MFHVEHFALVMEDGLKNALDVPCGTLADDVEDGCWK